MRAVGESLIYSFAPVIPVFRFTGKAGGAQGEEMNLTSASGEEVGSYSKGFLLLNNFCQCPL